MTNIEKVKLRDFRRRIVAGSFQHYASLPDAVDGLQFVQADPVRSQARAQDLILRQSVNGYKAGDLERVFPDMDVEEGYLFGQRQFES